MYQAVGFSCNRMLKLSSSRGIRIDVPVLSVSCSVVDHSVIIHALKKGLIAHEPSGTGGVPSWKSPRPDRLAEATYQKVLQTLTTNNKVRARSKNSPIAYFGKSHISL